MFRAKVVSAASCVKLLLRYYRFMNVAMKLKLVSDITFFECCREWELYYVSMPINRIDKYISCPFITSVTFTMLLNSDTIEFKFRAKITFFFLCWYINRSNFDYRLWINRIYSLLTKVFPVLSMKNLYIYI